ncbi:hypothetical protein [Marinitoga lauensis]|uniref:hypothetical protein n=1 Tax=Marinitoga lauensis TaxID=2201189 RepID=UPI001012311A|nr:hypothetical protein [Marinitoga lauensis]
MNVVSGLMKIHDIYSEISTFISENSDLINLLTTESPSPTALLKYIINMSDATETALLNIIEDINDFSNLIGSVKDGYLYDDIKYEINKFDWDGDGEIENTTALKFDILTQDGANITIPFYELFTLPDPPVSIKISQNGGDAIFDYEMFFGNIDENYNPIFNDNDYLLIDEGTAAGMSVFSKILGIIGKALFIYDLNNPSINIKNAINNDENLEEYISNLILDLMKNPPPFDSQKITGEELKNHIFGDMLTFKDNIKSIDLINQIKNDLLSFHDLVRMIFEDKIMDYIAQKHDVTSGNTPPVPKYDFDMSMDLLGETEKMSNFINNPSEGIEIPIGYNESFTLHPGVFFNNPDDFSDLNVFLPDISIVSTYDSTNLLIELPDPTFKGLVDGLDATIEINTEEFGKENYFIHQEEDITIVGTSVTFRWHPSSELNATITYEVIVDKNEDKVWDYIEDNIPSSDLMVFAKTSNMQITLQLEEGDYFWAVIGYADFGNGKIEKIYPENPFWFSVFLKNIYYYIDLLNPADEADFSEIPTTITFEWQAFKSENGEDNPVDVDYYIFHIEKLDGMGSYTESEETDNSTTVEITEDGKYGWWVDGYYTDPETFETIEIHSQYYTFKAGNVIETTYFYPIDPYDFIPALPGANSIEVHFAWGANNLQTEKDSNIFELYYREEGTDTWSSTTNINVYWQDDQGNYEAEAFVRGFTPGKSYEWKVKAFINDTEFVESEIWYFYIEESSWLSELHLIMPLDGEEATTNNIQFTWGMDPNYDGDFFLHVKPVDTWENTYDTLITPTDYSTGTDPYTNEMTFNYSMTLPDGAYKYWVSLENVPEEDYQDTEHRWFFINMSPYDVLLDYPEQNANFDYYTIWFSWHVAPPSPLENEEETYNSPENLTLEIIDSENNIVFSQSGFSGDDNISVDFDNPGIYYWYIKDEEDNILSAVFSFEIIDVWQEQQEEKINLFNPLNGEIFETDNTFEYINFNWEDLGENIEYEFFFKSAKELVVSDNNYLEPFDYLYEPYYNLELKKGPYIWKVESYDATQTYVSDVRSFNIASSDHPYLTVNGPSAGEKAGPLDTITFYASNTINPINYHIILFSRWGETWTDPGLFEESLVENPEIPLEFPLWVLFRRDEPYDIYYYAIVADDGNETIISPVRSFYYEPILKDNYVFFDPEYLNLSTSPETFTVNTQGANLTDIQGIEIHLRVDNYNTITFESSSISIPDVENSFIKSEIKYDEWNDEEFEEIIISIISPDMDLSDTQIASFSITSNGTFDSAHINITDASIIFKENSSPVHLENNNYLEISGQ